MTISFEIPHNVLARDATPTTTLRFGRTGKLLGDIPIHVVPNGIQPQSAIASASASARARASASASASARSAGHPDGVPGLH